MLRPARGRTDERAGERSASRCRRFPPPPSRLRGAKMRVLAKARSGRPRTRLPTWLLRLGIPLALMVATTTAVWAVASAPDLSIVRRVEPSTLEHLRQSDLDALVAAGHDDQAFDEAFEHGDELFETRFSALDGVGANVGNGQRFTRVPRADLRGTKEWANHTPSRATGPNAESCNPCHGIPTDDGAGLTQSNAVRDPLHSGNLGMFITRNTPALFGLGGLQVLGEEMTEDLRVIRQKARDDACGTSTTVVRALTTKGVNFGTIKVTRIGANPCATRVDTSGVQGLADDMVVRPFQWKGSVANSRQSVRDAAHNELGMQAVELVGVNVDGDGDGIVNELQTGDITAMTIYMASQPRPTTRIELASRGLIPALSDTEKAQIARGATVFNSAGCSVCHVPSLTITDPTFYEPSKNCSYRDQTFPAGQDPSDLGVDPSTAIGFDLTRDQPDNQIREANGRVIFRLGSFRRDPQSGKAIVELFGDLKRHDMGPLLAEPIDDDNTGSKSSFMTENLWGVGTTAPYLHDGRATTITESILWHSGEAETAKSNFSAAPDADKQALVAFLKNLVLFKQEE